MRWKAIRIVIGGDTADALALKNCRQSQADATSYSTLACWFIMEIRSD